jgi:GAF domain-containing protein
VLIPDTRLDPRWKSSNETGDVCSLINTPLLVQDHPIGVLFIGRTDETAYTQEEVNILFAFATHVAIAVENARLGDKREQRACRLQDMLELCSALKNVYRI